MYVYTLKDFDKLQARLSSFGVRSKLIGILPSNHDMDIMIVESSIPVAEDETSIEWLSRILKSNKTFQTDLNSWFFLSSVYGHVDVFFHDPEKCPKCGTRILNRK